MQSRKFRTLFAITAGSLTLAAVAITASSGTSQTAAHAALTARTQSFLLLNSTGTPPGQLNPGQQITSGTQIASPDGTFVLQMQSDGNLVLRAPGNIPLGDTHTPGHDGTIAVMQADGNFVLRAPGNIPIWASGTDGHPGTVLQVQDDGAVVLYAPGHQVLRVIFPAFHDSQNNGPTSTVLPATTPASSSPGSAQPASPNCSQEATQGPPSASIPPGQQSYFQCQPPGADSGTSDGILDSGLNGWDITGLVGCGLLGAGASAVATPAIGVGAGIACGAQFINPPAG